MSNQAVFLPPRLWSCNWNWCPETFRDSRDLGKHLQETHYNNILQVKKRDWDAYLRSTEGRSGATASWLPSQTPGNPHSPCRKLVWR
ncbi:transcription factor [Ganoderma sinense ZZ0214-1]|uniref:Transcription factor n=1 Tax=Ganoderma sinense ZZ0214-1 TaxID=1077348 RepID=A0A2G8SJ07_9APHY|nr:transcription factor [Ganoderma sinense ZZ0214-1]